MIPASADDSVLATELQLAIDRGELSLVFQPKVEIASGRLAGVEALTRWTHPVLGPVEPCRFVPLAERFGLIDQLTDWLVRTGLKQWVGWKNQGLKTNLAV